MIDQVTAILCEVCGAEPGELGPDLNLFDSGLLDSFAVVELLLALETECGVSLDIASLTREEFATPALIATRVQKELEP